jgi:fructokinase
MNPIVGIGEILWDVYPDGRKVAGGAPFNFAFHCHQLGHPAVIVSRVGADELGRELRSRVRELGLSDEYIQTDPDHPTGTVQVALDASAVPTYTITENVAWDHITWDDKLANLAAQSRGLCFGTLGQRGESSEAIVHFLQTAGGGCGGAYRVLDVNLRQHFYSPALLRACIWRAPVVKVSEEELRTVCDVLGLPGTTTREQVRSVFRFSSAETRFVYVTRGADGAEAYYERDPEPVIVRGVPVRVVDTVGAGDAFTAAVMCLMAESRRMEEQVRFAVHYAARVCEQPGGTPRISRGEVERAAGLTP